MMDWKSEGKALAVGVAGFLILYFLPVDSQRLQGALLEAVYLARWYAREHVLLCLIPAFFIAGGIGAFVSQGAVMAYLGRGANKVLAYGVASVSGTLLAVCSCTVLPLFAGIYRMGAGLGPACAFLYSGPAINVLAIILTARILGPELGAARAIGAIVFSVAIGLLMAAIFRDDDARAAKAMVLPPSETKRPLWQDSLFFAVMTGILVFANWGATDATDGVWAAIFQAKWAITAALAALFGLILAAWYGLPKGGVVLAAMPVAGFAWLFPHNPVWAFSAGVVGLSVLAIRAKGEAGDWFAASWGFAKQIVPLLFGGVLAAGLLLGRVGHEGLIPSEWIAGAVGGNSVGANLFAAVARALMYFATLTEGPILQGLIGSGMGQGPALALLLAGPALSLPNMLVIHSILGVRKTATFIALVVLMAAASGWTYGHVFN